MPELLPHPWEMTPRYRVLDSAPCAISCAGANCWQLHLVKLPSWNYSFLWMRPQGIESDAGFVAIHDEFKRVRIFGGTERLQTLDPSAEEVVTDDALARRFVLNTRGELRAGNQRAHEILTVSPDGIARWNDRNNHDNTPFRWRPSSERLTGAQFVALPAAQVWRELQNLLANANGEAAFAREFARMETTKRHRRIQKPRRGEVAELEMLLHQLLLARAPWETASDDELFLSFSERENGRLWKISRSHPRELDVPAALRAGVRHLWDYFEPFDPTIAGYLCVKNTDAPSLFARSRCPSAHQQLEAQLRFREWEQATI